VYSQASIISSLAVFSRLLFGRAEAFLPVPILGVRALVATRFEFPLRFCPFLGVPFAFAFAVIVNPHFHYSKGIKPQ